LAQSPNANANAPGKPAAILGAVTPTISTDQQIEFLKAFGDQAAAALAAERALRAFEAVRNKLIAVCGDKYDLAVDEKGKASCAPKAEPAAVKSVTPAPPSK